MSLKESTYVASLVIAEPSASGHRLWYVRLLAEAALRDGLDDVVILTTRAATGSDQWRTHLGQIEGRVRVVSEPSDVPDWRRWALSTLRADPPDRLVLPDGDKWLVSLVTGERPASQVSVLLMRPDLPSAFWARIRGLGKTFVVRAVERRSWVTLFSLAMFPRKDAARFREIPDPVELSPTVVADAAKLRANLGVPDDQVLALVIGELSERKSVGSVCEAWMLVPDPGARLALIGSVRPDARESVDALSATDDRVLVREGYVSDEDFDAWVGASDVVLSLHQNIGSSGVALKAWALGRTSMVFEGSDLHADLTRSSGQVVATPSGVEGIAASLAAAVQKPASGPPHAESAATTSRTEQFTSALLGRSSAP